MMHRPHISPKTWRAIRFWSLIVIVLVLCAVELAWMAQRVTDQRALRAKEHTPPKVISLPFSGFKP
jgi:hypothetical protein